MPQVKEYVSLLSMEIHPFILIDDGANVCHLIIVVCVIWKKSTVHVVTADLGGKLVYSCQEKDFTHLYDLIDLFLLVNTSPCG